MLMVKAEKPQAKTKLERYLPWLLIVAGILGTIFSFVIMIEKINLLENPGYQTSCDINPIISCGSVMQAEQSNLMGFPNPIIGLMAFPALATIGLALLAGAALKRWFWLGIQAGLFLGLVFVHWLFFQTVYNINAICPYCTGVWIVTIASFWYVLLYNLRKGFIRVPDSWGGVAGFMQRHHVDILVLWYLVLTVLILNHFWYYFGTLL